MKKIIVIILAATVAGGIGFAVYQNNISNKNEVKDKAPETSSIAYSKGPYEFKAGNQSFLISYDQSSDHALLDMGGKEYELNRAVSGSGARYTNDDESVVFWEHAGEAMIEVNGVTIIEHAVLENPDPR